MPFSPKWSNQDNLDKCKAQRDNNYKQIHQKSSRMAGFTFEKQEKGKTKPQFLLKK